MFSVFWRCLIPKADNPIIQQQQQHEHCPMSTTTFDRLTSDVVGKIFGNLPIGDRVRMRLVSKSWRDRLVRSDFPIKPEPPWRLLPIDSFEQPKHLSTKLSFESMSEERTYRFESPACRRFGVRYRWCCCGSSSDGGWLLLAGRRAGHGLSKTVMILWDPISGTTKRLPTLSTLPFFRELVNTCKRVGLGNISTSLVIAHAQVLSVGCVVAVVFVTNHDHRLALCSPEDQSWSIVPYGPDGIYTDMLFHKGKLHILNAKKRASNSADPTITTGLKCRCTVRLSCCDVEVIMLDLVYVDDRVGSWKLVERRNVTEQGSSAGELLVVSSISDLCPNRSDQGIVYQTNAFEVYVLDVANNTNNKGFCCLERLRHVGNQCIYLGATGSMSIESVVDCSNIHFATYDAWGVCRRNEEQHGDLDEEEEFIELNEIFVVHEQGVFDMVRDKIERSYLTSFSIQTGSCTGWFTPKLPT